MFTFAVGTGELRQCFDITIPVDNLLEQQEFFSLMAGTASATFIINDAEGNVHVKLSFVATSSFQF